MIYRKASLKRDLEMIARHQAGESISDLVKAFGLSPWRVNLIVNRRCLPEPLHRKSSPDQIEFETALYRDFTSTMTAQEFSYSRYGRGADQGAN